MVGPAPGMPSVSPGDVLLQPSPSRDREQGDARIAEVRTRGPGLAVLLEAAITFVTRHHRARGGTEGQGKAQGTSSHEAARKSVSCLFEAGFQTPGCGETSLRGSPLVKARGEGSLGH